MARNRRVRPWRMLASTSLPLSLTDAAPATGTAAADVTVAVTVRTGEVEEPPDEEPAPTRPHDHPRARGHVHASVPAQGGGAVEPAAIVDPQPAARRAGQARRPCPGAGRPPPRPAGAARMRDRGAGPVLDPDEPGETGRQLASAPPSGTPARPRWWPKGSGVPAPT